MSAAPGVPSQLTGSAQRDWTRLSAPQEHPEVFDPTKIQQLPEPVRRWLTHAIAAGTPLHGSATLTMHGHIKLGRWRRFQARQVLTPPQGFLWAATAYLAGLPITGFDRYTGGTGQMRWRLLGIVPVASADGPDITRSAAGRLASELVMVPAAALAPNVTWHDAGPDHADAHISIGDASYTATITVASNGALRSVTIPRWGNPDERGYREHLFGAEFHHETTLGGYTTPTTVSAGWWYGTSRWTAGEFIRFTIDDLTHH